MKKIIKRHYNIIRRFPIIVIILIMSISILIIGLSVNYIVSYNNYTSLTRKISKIEKKADKGTVYDYKNLYVYHWTDELIRQRQQAEEEKETLVRESYIANWLKEISKFEAFLLKIIAILAIGYGVILEYSSILALARRIHDRHNFLTNPKYFKYWNWKRQYKYTMHKAKLREQKADAMKWIHSLN